MGSQLLQNILQDRELIISKNTRNGSFCFLTVSSMHGTQIHVVKQQMQCNKFGPFSTFIMVWKWGWVSSFQKRSPPVIPGSKVPLSTYQQYIPLPKTVLMVRWMSLIWMMFEFDQPYKQAKIKMQSNRRYIAMSKIKAVWLWECSDK